LSEKKCDEKKGGFLLRRTLVLKLHKQNRIFYSGGLMPSKEDAAYQRHISRGGDHNIDPHEALRLEEKRKASEEKREAREDRRNAKRRQNYAAEKQSRGETVRSYTWKQEVYPSTRYAQPQYSRRCEQKAFFYSDKYIFLRKTFACLARSQYGAAASK
jgi:hypothetical protein